MDKGQTARGCAYGRWTDQSHKLCQLDELAKLLRDSSVERELPRFDSNSTDIGSQASYNILLHRVVVDY